ncbi:MAG: hypothetical protein V8S27_07735 [Lachnospiraceae bacterium]
MQESAGSGIIRRPARSSIFCSSRMTRIRTQSTSSASSRRESPVRFPLARRAVARLVAKENPQKNETFNPVRPAPKRFYGCNTRRSRERQSRKILFMARSFAGVRVCDKGRDPFRDSQSSRRSYCDWNQSRTRATMGHCRAVISCENHRYDRGRPRE